MLYRLTLALAAVALLAPSAAAQEISGWDNDPYAGVLTLDAGFSGDPRTMDVTPGGSQANPLSGSGCVGYIGLSPDVVVDYDAGSLDLTFSAASDTDINLVVRTPGGRYYCDDDSGEGLNPVVTIDRPRSGEYTVWVGVFGSSGEYVDGVFGVSELAREVSMADRGARRSGPSGGRSSAEVPGWDEDPYFDTVRLSSGFSGDPYTVAVDAGGAQGNPLTGSGCVGYLGLRPDVVLDYDAGAFDLTLSVDSDTDVNLVVRDPRGDYYCDDDSGEGLNPMLTITDPADGEYTIWAGVYGESSEYVDAVVGISELGRAADGSGGRSSGGRASGGAEIPGWTADPYFGETRLRAGFSDDPRTVRIDAGGAQANPLTGSGCVGYIGSRPDHVLDYDAGSLDLTLSAASDSDINLVVRTPSGRYLCDDDSGEGLNPRIEISNPQSGEYTIWVGTFSDRDGDTVRSTFAISELGREAR